MRQTRPRYVPGYRGRAAPPAARPSIPPPPRPFALGSVVVRWLPDLQRFVCLCGYDDRHIAKEAGFWWDPQRKHWWTDDDVRAGALIRFADNNTEAKLRPAVSVDHAAFDASRATDSDIEIPAPAGLNYMPFQRAGIAYAMDRPNTLIGDAMGLGKTIQAIGVMNADESPFPALVVCPASLKINWRRELEKWLVHETLPMIAGVWFPITADVVICNYDRLKKHHRAIASKHWRTLIVDEAHFLKNEKTQRAQEVYSIAAERKLFLTGTPIPNRVPEIYPLLAFLAPTVFGDKTKFLRAYGGANPYTVHGKKMLDEFNVKVRSTVMVRRLKEEVLTELPPKVRQVIEFTGEGVEHVIAEERNRAQAFEEKMHTLRVALELAKASDDPKDYAAAVIALKAGQSAAFSEISKLRHDTAIVKVPFILEHLRNVLAEGEKLVLFAHHHDVIRAYSDAFPKVTVTLTGENTMQERDAAVQRFQKDPDCKLFVGGIQAAGVGLTLTAASHVAFAEIDWVPGNMTQAEDRCHRIGQKDSVLVQHLVLEGSLDATMAKTLVAKQGVIDAALDGDKAELSGEPIVPTLGEPATMSATKAAIAREALMLDAEAVAAIHRAIRYIAELCDGARAQDGAGFNKIDAGIGRSLAASAALTTKQAALARRVVRKYMGQLPEELREEIE